jgi:hypothetical protein
VEQAAAGGSGITSSITDVAGLTITHTALVNRRYKITASVLIQSSVSTDQIDLMIRDGSANILNRTRSATIVGYSGMFIQTTKVPGAGSVTWKASVVRAAGSGNLDIYGDVNFRNFLLVEDIGT